MKHNNIVGYSYCNGDMFRSFRPSSGHLTGTYHRYMQCTHAVWYPI